MTMSATWARTHAWAAKHPLALAILAGAVARLVGATWGLSFHARDDYFHVVDPAVHWLENPAFDWNASDLAGAGIRSHLVPRVVWLLFLGARTIGITSPEAMLRLVYATVGAYSLLVIPAVSLFARRLTREETARRATWLAALYFAMPYLGTRLLIESLAMPPLVLGLYLATSQRPSRLLGAGVLVGLACWFRFQVGAAALGLAGVIAVRAWKQGGLRAVARELVPLTVGGAIAIGAQGLFDLWTTGRFLGPVLANVDINLHPHAELSRSTPLAYVGMWLLLTLPPATLVLLAPMVRAGMRYTIATWPFLIFVL
ncbi:MAG: hypothetical protein AAB426_09500, partial [Myxococcota bacterium]